MSSKPLTLFCFFVLALTACSGEVETAVTPTPLPATATTIPATVTTLSTAIALHPVTREPAMISPQPTVVPPTLELPTATPTAVPTIVPNAAVDSPTDPLRIAPENADQLTTLVEISIGRIDGLSWSPDGEMFAIATSQGIELYDGRTLETIRTTEFAVLSQFPNKDLHFSPSGNILALTFSGQDSADSVGFVDAVNGLFFSSYVPLDTSSSPIFSPDGQSVISLQYVTSEATRLVWQDIRTGETLRSVDVPFHPTAFTHEIFVEIYQNTTLRLYETTHGQLQHTFELPAAVNHIVFNPQGNLLAVDSQDNTIRLLDVQSGELWQSMALPRPSVELTFNQQGDRLITSSTDSLLRVWDVQSGKLLQTVATEMAGTRFITFSLDGRTLVTGSGPGRAIRLWDMVTGQLRHELTLQPGCGSGDRLLVTSSPDGALLAVVSGNDVQFFDVTSGALHRSLEGYCPGSDIAFNPEGSELLTFGGSYDVRYWEVPGGQLLQIQTSTIRVQALAFSPDGKWMAWGGGDQQYQVQMWDRNSGQLLYTIEEEIPPVNKVVFSPDGLLMATQSKDIVQLREVQTGHLLFSHEANRLAFSPDGRYLATSLFSIPSTGDRLEVWDTATFQQVRRFDGLYLLTFGPDGNLLARQGDEWSRQASWWSVDSGELLGPFPGQDASLDFHILNEAYDFSPDGRLVLGARGIFGNLTMADVVSGETVWDWILAQGIFSPDGRYLATTSGDGIVRLWGLLPATP